MTTRPYAELDIECFHNWFLVGITDRATGTRWDYQMVPGTQLDLAALRVLLQHYTIVTFNGQGYDLPMLAYALTGADCAQLKAANDDIIESHLIYWQFYKKYRAWPPDYIDHIDVAEPTPGVKIGLKAYACRLGSELVQDSPVDFRKPLPMDHVVDEILYCQNDRGITGELFDAIKPRIELRERMSTRYGVDLRSKSDAQMAEAMVKAELIRRVRESLAAYAAEPADLAAFASWPHQSVDHTIDSYGNVKITIPTFQHGTTFRARIPPYVAFATPYMQDFLELVRNCDFLISNKDEAELMGIDGKGIKTGVMIPDALKGRDIVIGQTTYRVGIGGLHSQESSVYYQTIPGVQTLRTADVGSYYPSLILNAGMNPTQLGPLFSEIYGEAYRERLAAKAAAKKLTPGTPEHTEQSTVEGGFKIVLNGTFGKLFSRFSIFYAPEFGIAVTIGGQLSLLMLIERLELSGIRVVSANTDGIEMLVPAGREWLAEQIIEWWQHATNLTLDTKSYLALAARDVNNYISLQFDGSVKRKGVFGESGVLNNKHPDCDICADAVVAYLSKGTPLQETIYGCQDIRKFVRVRGAKGGASWFRAGVSQWMDATVVAGSDDPGTLYEIDGQVVGSATPTPTRVLVNGEHLGRAVRWYYALDCNDYIVDSKSLNKVAGSDGARPVMRLPATCPTDINRAHYVQIAEDMLRDIGVLT